MSGWEVLAVIAALGWGGLTFLRLVANEVQAVGEDLCEFERREQKALRRRQEAEMELAAVA